MEIDWSDFLSHDMYFHVVHVLRSLYLMSWILTWFWMSNQSLLVFSQDNPLCNATQETRAQILFSPSWVTLNHIAYIWCQKLNSQFIHEMHGARCLWWRICCFNHNSQKYSMGNKLTCMTPSAKFQFKVKTKWRRLESCITSAGHGSGTKVWVAKSVTLEFDEKCNFFLLVILVKILLTFYPFKR